MVYNAEFIIYNAFVMMNSSFLMRTCAPQVEPEDLT